MPAVHPNIFWHTEAISRAPPATLQSAHSWPWVACCLHCEANSTNIYKLSCRCNGESNDLVIWWYIYIHTIYIRIYIYIYIYLSLSSILFLDSEAIGVLSSSIGWVSCLRFGVGMLVLLQGAVAGCCFRVCALALACWCRCRGRCEMSVAVWALGPDGDYVYAVSKTKCCWLLPNNILCYLGSILA